MSRENMDRLRQGIEALNRGDVDEIGELLHPEAEWRPALTAGGDLERPVYRGRAGFAEYLDDLAETFTSTYFQIESFEAIDANRIFYRGRATAEGRTSGVRLDVPVWAIWEFRDGEIFRGTAFLSEAEALQAAGLSE